MSGGRVLHVVPALFDGEGRIAGGAERYAYELARHMAELRPTSLLSFGPSRLHETDGRLEVTVLPGEWTNRAGAHDPVSNRLVAAVRTSGTVHCHQRNVRATKVAALAAKAMRRSAFVTDHGGGVWGLGTWLPDRRLFDAHLYVSAFSREVMPPPPGVRSEVLWGGVDHRRFAPGGEGPGEAPLFVGRLLPHKGVDVLLAALPEGMGAEVAGAPLDERYAHDLRSLAGQDVRFHQDWDDADLISGYRRALCVVLPSVYEDCYGTRTNVPELLGQTLLEGMACGIPAVCTAVGGMPEVVRDGVTGFVVPPNDPEALRAVLRRLRDEPDLAARMGETARRHVEERFTWSAVAARCLRAYAA